MGTTTKIIEMPIRPANPISLYSMAATITVSNGAIHIAFIHSDTHSNRFTSFERRLTTLPGDVSPSAVCDNRRDL